jgi:two-component system cell cycle sensor histidine kinase/response regulator CckA
MRSIYFLMLCVAGSLAGFGYVFLELDLFSNYHVLILSLTSALVLLIGAIWVSNAYVIILNRFQFLLDILNSMPKALSVFKEKSIIFENANAKTIWKSSSLGSTLREWIVKKLSLTTKESHLVDTLKLSSPELTFSIHLSKMQKFNEYCIMILDEVSRFFPSQNTSSLPEINDQIPVGLFCMNAQGHILYSNSVVDEWLSKRQSHTFNLFKLLDVEDDQHTLFPEKKIIAEGKIYEHYFSIHKQFYRVFQKFTKSPDGSYLSNSVLFKSRRNKLSIQIEEKQYQQLFEDAPISVVVIDRFYNILSANHSFSKAVRKSEEDLKGKLLDSLLNPICLEMVHQQLKRTFEKNTAPSKPIEIVLNTLRSSDMAAYMSPMINEEGRAISVVIYMFSTTEQKKMEVQFVQSQRMQAVGQLAGGVAHDFNNLLTAMIGFCDLLLQRHSPSEQTFSDVMQIKQNANRASSLVRQLLAFSRQQSLQPKVVNITDTLSDLSVLLRRLLGPSIDFNVSHDRQLWNIKVDKGQLEQVIINLVVNARDAMNNQGSLTIRTENIHNKKTLTQRHDTMPPGDYVLIEVVDQGSGIPEEIMDRIFEPFFSTKAVGMGTGLGLSTVFGIVKQTGGFVFVESKVGIGTTFKIHFPKHSGDETETQKSSEERTIKDLTGNATILLVEDEDAVRMFASRALRDKGYSVLEAGNGTEAITFTENSETPIDLIITDVVMPGMDGPKMINEVKKLAPQMKVIFISGYAEDSFRQKLDSEENIHFLQKPFSLKDLATKVKDILD